MKFHALLLALGCISGCHSSDPAAGANGTDSLNGAAEIVEQRIDPSTTGQGIDPAAFKTQYHHVALPKLALQRKNLLVVHMVGSLGNPENALVISQFAATLGFGVLNIQYPNTSVVGVVCGGRDNCYGEYRGETIFGEDVAYAPGLASYNEASNFVTKENSVINRVVNLLDFLANQEASDLNPQPGYWQQFLIADASSPYSATHFGKAYPDWSKIIISGHSQGGGMASMLGMNLADIPARRVIMFSSPNDNTGGVNGNLPANWLLQKSATPMKNFWGLRHPNDTSLGGNVQQSWAAMGGPGAGGVGGPDNNEEVDISNGTGDPMSRQRLVVTEDVGDASTSHQASVDPAVLPGVIVAWEYLFTGGDVD